MTLQQIYYALTIAQTKSMNKAAEKLFISQPSLTNAIKELEKETGIIIFRRTSKGVTKTSEGEEFLMYARQVYQQYELLEEKYIDVKNAKRKFGISTQHYSFAVKAFVETVKQFDTTKYEFAVREEKTYDVIQDVGSFKSEIGIIYMSDFNRKIIEKMLRKQYLEFHRLIECNAYVYIWKNHPLAIKSSITMKELEDYPCLSFEQGEQESSYLAEEILTDNEYQRTIKACDRATMLNLMIGLNGYTLCSGIICEELNGEDYIAIPFEDDDKNRNSIMEIGYIIKKGSVLSEIGTIYIDEVKKYLHNVKSMRRIEMNRDTAWDLLKKYNKDTFHLRHALTVEKVMKYYARELGYDEEYWGIVGLLHDIDFEQYPEEHCIKAPELLKEGGFGEDIIHAVCSHGYKLTVDVKPEHEMEKVLYATDELTGLIWAAAEMRPSKSVQDMELKSLKKKYKSKNFAAGCSREVIERGADMLGWELDDLLWKTILAMRNCEDTVNTSVSEL